MSTRLTWRLGVGPRVNGPGAGPLVTRAGDTVDITMGMGGTSKRFTVLLYVDAQNVLNHVNTAGYSGVMTSPFFGRPTIASAARQLQIGAQFVF